MSEKTLDEIIEEIQTNKKYSVVDKSVIYRLCIETAPKHSKSADVIKAVKKELHIIHESFLSFNNCVKTEKLLDSYKKEKNILADREFALRLMSLHSSTSERFFQTEKIYSFISGYIDAGSSVMDIGCGYNPFALPFLHSLPGSYTAYDISGSLVNLLNKFFLLTGLSVGIKPLYRAELFDAVVQMPDTRADVLLMLKLFPLLERQKRGRAFDIINSLEFKTAIISYPLKSASGREKGMEAFYSSNFEKRLPPQLNITEKKVFKNEMFYVVETA